MHVSRPPASWLGMRRVVVILLFAVIERDLDEPTLGQALRDDTVLVTGGTRGIGLATVDAMRRHGARVISVSRAPAEASVPHYQADIANRTDLERIRLDLESRDLVPTVLVANAAAITRAPFLDTEDADLSHMIMTNVYGTLATLQVFAPVMLRRRGARFIVVSSITAVHGMGLRVVYSATKAALAGLVRSLAIEWGPLGATVNAVAPGIVRTPLTNSYIDRFPARAEATIRNTPLGRLAEPEDVADVIAAMASKAFRFVTGQLIVVDGGITAGSSWW